MISTEIRPTLSALLAGLRDVPLDEMPAVDGAILDGAVACLLPEFSVAPVPVAAFQSAI
jgi:hypothetical protein